MSTDSGSERGGLVEAFSTEAVTPQRRLQYWNDLICETFTAMTIDADREGPFAAGLDRVRLGSAVVANVRAAASEVRHTADHVRRSTGDPSFLLHLQVAGSSVNSQAGRDTALSAGDFTLCDATRPYLLAFNEETHFLVVRLPAADLKRRLPNAEDMVSLRCPGGAGRSAILTSFLQTVSREASQSDDVDWADDVASVIADLVALGCRGLSADQRHEITSDLQERILATIDSNLRDADFGVQQLASQIGVAPRSIQRMFAARGSTPTAYILKRRLAEAARGIELGRESITDIAMQYGFNDLTYFGRAFRRTYGLAPSEYRRRLRH
jgi:AraC-like DNA-binding protein